MARNTKSDVPTLTFEEVSALFSYDPVTGIIRWKIASSRYRPNSSGTEAGTFSHGYRTVRINGVTYPSHRVAWLLMTGRWPIHQIDHVDCQRSNNSWSNLREATQRQNCANVPVRKHSQCGIKGIRFRPDLNKWQARLKNKHLGLFHSPEEASSAFKTAAIAAYGEFARIE